MTDTTDPTQAAPAEAPAAPEGERIAKAIARAGIASRRDAEAMIEAGRVSLNGKVLTSPAINVTEVDRIVIDGEPLPARERTRLWILHKPRGVVTTARDPEGRATVFDGLPDELPRVVAIGRLDINTEGLLLLTNDGGLAKVIAHPDTGWLRRYRVRAFGDVTQADLDKLRKGVTVDGMEYGPVEATLDRAQGDNVWLTLGLREGKNREVKRILEHLGLSVNRLIRLSFGPFQLGDLEVGLVEEIRTKVLKEQLGKTLAEEAGVDFESPVREAIAPFGSPKKAAKVATRGAEEGERSGAPKARSAGRPPRDPARPASAPRGAERAPAKTSMAPARAPSPTVWRADDEERPRAAKVPRRGGDPKAARAAAAERGRERVGAIKAVGERRVLVERLQASPEAPAAEPHRRVRFRNNEEGAERQDRRPREDRPERNSERGDARSAAPRRAPAGDARPRRRDEDSGAERRGPPREHRTDGEGRPPRERSEGAPRRERSFDAGAPERRGPPRDRPRPDRSGGDARPPRAPRGEGRFENRQEGRPERSGGFKGAGRPAGGGGKPGFKGGARQGEARDGGKGGFKGGFKAGGGGGGGGRPGGGFKSGGARPGGGGRPGGAGGGGRPGGKPGGSRGGGRPPRGGA
ncbi:pseudouridine synthase [Methylorubrum sp. POS3]|uniref:pseudouridine synthase n=1 Tax=Methylorubrum sp. POS3 TaxID=2998492 RepID=UPI003729CC1E